MRFLAAVLLLVLPSAGFAQHFGFFAGPARGGDPAENTRGWLLEYSRDVTPFVYGSVNYVNEGHVPGHHRDGMATQLGLQAPLGESGVTLRAAAGPYYYFDTTLAENPSGYADAHGWGALYTLGTRWQPRGRRWSAELRVDRAQTKKSIDTTMVLAGLGFELEQDGTFPANATPRDKGGAGELVGYLGATIVNSFESENSTARSVEYRHQFGPVLRASAGWINEGDARLIRRNGVVFQGWLEPTFFDGVFSLGVGYGAYLALDAYRPEQRHNLGLLSTTASLRVSRSWDARITWHRSVSGYDRDSDILLAGLGYRF